MYSESTSILCAEGETWQFCLLLNYCHKIQHSKKASLPVEQTSFEFFCLWWRTIFIQTDLSEVTLYFVGALIRQRRHFYIQVTEHLLENLWVFIRHVVVQFIHPDNLSMLVIMSHHRITAHYSQISISILKICFSVCTHVNDWCLCTCIFLLCR